MRNKFSNTQCGFLGFLVLSDAIFPICWVLVEVKDFIAFCPLSPLHTQKFSLFFLHETPLQYV